MESNASKSLGSIFRVIRESQEWIGVLIFRMRCRDDGSMAQKMNVKKTSIKKRGESEAQSCRKSDRELYRLYGGAKAVRGVSLTG